MKLVSLTLPDDSADWPAWLEQQLMGVELQTLIRELEILAPQPAPPPDLDDVIGDHWPLVFERGLGSLGHERIRQLIRHPRLLLDLQEQVLISGGSYWRALPPDEAASRGSQRVRERVNQELNRQSLDATSPMAARQKSPRTERSRAISWVAALAASLLAAVGIWNWFSTRPESFAWESPQSIAADMPAEDYGNYLGDALREWWFSDQPESRDELIARLTRFRTACETLIDAQHPQLTAQQRTELVTKCRNWLTKINAHLAEASDEASDLSEVRAESNETVRAATKALQQLFG